jgi:hypothetical protein
MVVVANSFRRVDLGSVGAVAVTQTNTVLANSVGRIDTVTGETDAGSSTKGVVSGTDTPAVT